MKEMIYQRIKTYEMGAFRFVFAKQVRGWYKPQSGYSDRGVEGEARLDQQDRLRLSADLQVSLNRPACDQ